MGQELIMPDAASVDIQFIKTNLPANATTVMTLPNTGTGFQVPAGWKFHPVGIIINGSTAVTAQTVTAAVTDNGTTIANGPTAVLDSVTNTTSNSGVARADCAPIAAGHVIGANLTTPAGFTPTTNTYDVIVMGFFTLATTRI